MVRFYLEKLVRDKFVARRIAVSYSARFMRRQTKFHWAMIG